MTPEPGQMQGQPASKFMATQSPDGLVSPGNIDLTQRPIVHNTDGSISTVRSISIGTDGGEVLIPTVVNGRVVSNEQAIQHYKQTGENLGTFQGVAQADAYAEALHRQQAAEYLPQTPQSDPSGGMGIPSAPPPMAAQGQLGVSAPKAGVTLLSPAEIKQIGLPDGTVAQRDPTGKINVVSKGINVQGDSTAPVFGDGTKSGQDYIQSVPADEQSVLKALLNGTKEPPKGTTLKSPYWQSMFASAYHADPSWNEGSFKQYADTRRYFTNGKGGIVINNISTAMQHASELMDTIQALDNGSQMDISRLKNAVGEHFGREGKTNFDAVLTPLASEMASVYKNGNAPTDQETNEWRDKLSSSMSKNQQMGVLNRWVDLLKGKMNSVRNQYRSGMSNMADPLTVVNPDARNAIARIEAYTAKIAQSPPSHPAPLGDAPIYAPGGKTSLQDGTEIPQQGQSGAVPAANDADPLGILK